jgi:putative cell wall-binding protein
VKKFCIIICAASGSGGMEVNMKKIRKYIVVLLVLSLLVAFLPQDASASESYTRLAGQTRYQTSKAVAESFNSGQVDNVVIATGNDFADALSVSVLAGQKDAPILLANQTTSKSQEALDYISKHMSRGKVWIAGGTGVIDSSFKSKLDSMGNSVERIAENDRYGTCLAIAEKVNAHQGTPVFIASGENFPDALSIASAAASRGYPIILSRKNALPNGVENYLSRQQPSEVFIIGGTGVISPSVESNIKAILPAASVTRIAGQDRFETSSAAYEQFFPNPSSIYIASGMDFADALSASVLAAKNDAPIVLIDPNKYFPPDSTFSYLIGLSNPNVIIIGGTGVVSKPLADAIEFFLTDPNPDPDQDPDQDPVESNNYTLSSATTSNSTIFLNGTVSPGVTEILVQAENTNGGYRNNFYTPQNGLVSGTIYLVHGAGTYTVTIYEKVQGTERTYSGVSAFTVENTDTRTDLQFLFPSRDVQSDNPEIINLAESITKGLASDYDRIRAVHDWVAKNIAYDIEGLNNDDYVYDALGVLHARKSVCQGYADLSAALLRSVGVKTKIVHGVADSYGIPDHIRKNPEEYSNHAWNEAYADGRWVVFDATWDAGYVNFEGTEFTFRYQTKYWDPDPEVFAIDHIKTGVDKR